MQSGWGLASEKMMRDGTGCKNNYYICIIVMRITVMTIALITFGYEILQ